jgi:hypothetical protein
MGPESWSACALPLKDERKERSTDICCPKFDKKSLFGYRKIRVAERRLRSAGMNGIVLKWGVKASEEFQKSCHALERLCFFLGEEKESLSAGRPSVSEIP